MGVRPQLLNPSKCAIRNLRAKHLDLEFFRVLTQQWQIEIKVAG